MDREVVHPEFEPEDFRADGDGVEVPERFRDRNPRSNICIDTEMFQNWLMNSEERWLKEDSFRCDKVDVRMVDRRMRRSRRNCIVFYTAKMERREEDGSGDAFTKISCNECIHVLNRSYFVTNTTTLKLERRRCHELDFGYLTLVKNLLKFCDFCNKMCVLYKSID